jgi:hypothetical protein
MESLEDTPRYSVHVAGSLVEGLGNRNSDVDVFVIGEAAPSGESVGQIEGCTTSMHYVDTRRVDYQYWTDAQVDEVVRRLDGDADLAIGELVFLHRLRTGVAIAGAARLDALRARVPFDRLASCQREVARIDVDNALEDLYGMIDDGDHELALLRSRDLLDAALDAFRFTLGDTNPRGKWRIKIVAGLADQAPELDLVERYWALLPARRDDAVPQLKACIAFANEVIEWLEARLP